MVGANTAYTIDHPMNRITFRQLSGGSIPILYTLFLWCQQVLAIIEYLKRKQILCETLESTIF